MGQAIFISAIWSAKKIVSWFCKCRNQLAVEWEITLDKTNDSQLTDDQKQAVKKLDDYILSISGSANLQHWNDDALCYSNEWVKMRGLAKVILDTMGWSNDVSPERHAIYIDNKWCLESSSARQ